MEHEHESEIGLVVSSILAMETAASLDRLALVGCLRERLEQGLIAVVRATERRVDRIELMADGDEHFFLGYAASICRLVLHLAIEPRGRVATITLRATKGQRDAYTSVGWGERDLDVGNSLLVACVLHVGVIELRRRGVRAIANQPYNASLRARYASMGFHRGEYLGLDDVAALTRAFSFIAEVYGKHGLNLFDLPS
ncbi:hypothetical protein [Enhygromyxa salina]|uniref:Uncharacterized protein n=1 Tax=Enhygromyxa salina TaxID=215803 RepID=A0A2S9YJK5_9BACT|nr:hypothetical protein [Enhygromyxa salina]PRQ05216.1 hypothetical protein ENSA7_46660 [Enhygromyxa salina]